MMNKFESNDAERHHLQFNASYPSEDPCADEDVSSSNNGIVSQCSTDDEEDVHFANVCFAFNYYKTDSLKEVARIESHFHSLSEADKSLLIEGILSRTSKMKNAILMNQRFIERLLNPDGSANDDHGNLHPLSPHSVETKTGAHSLQNPAEQILGTKPPTVSNASGYERPTDILPQNVHDSLSAAAIPKEAVSHLNHPAQAQSHSDEPNNNLCFKTHVDMETLARNLSKVRGTLRQFVREWSKDGESERNAAFIPLLTALDTYMPVKDSDKPPRILCPGSGLGRLPFEVIKKGYDCQGNEFSYFMLIGSNFILNYLIAPESFSIYPYCLNTSNRRLHNDHLKEVRIPDAAPSDFVKPSRDFSMCGGEFVEVYAGQTNTWDGVLTCFFIDTAKNILLYIRTIAKILKPGGLWANFGPLLYHYAEMPDAISIELSWEEIQTVVERWFTIKEISWKDSFYTSNDDSIMQVLYHAIYFAAIRNENPVLGESNSVFS